MAQPHKEGDAERGQGACSRKQAEIRIASSQGNFYYGGHFTPKSGEDCSFSLDLSIWDVRSLKQNPHCGSTALYIFLKVTVTACVSGAVRQQELAVEIKHTWNNHSHADILLIFVQRSGLGLRLQRDCGTVLCRLCQSKSLFVHFGLLFPTYKIRVVLNWPCLYKWQPCINSVYAQE